MTPPNLLEQHMQYMHLHITGGLPEHCVISMKPPETKTFNSQKHLLPVFVVFYQFILGFFFFMLTLLYIWAFCICYLENY